MRPYLRIRIPGCATILLLALVALGLPAAAEEPCLECHGERDLRSEAGRRLYVNPARYQSSVHGEAGCEGCHSGKEEFPHAPGAPAVCVDCHDEAAPIVQRSVHAELDDGGCSDCHGASHVVGPPSLEPGAECADCHEDAVTVYRDSVHAKARAEGDPAGAVCRSCHGPAHALLASSEPESSIAKRNLPDTCAACHADPDFLARHKIPFARPVEAYRLSVHGRAVAAGREEAATCSDCHTSHGIQPARDPRSTINHWNVLDTCGQCHRAVSEAFSASVHGQAVRNGARGAPTCTDCHGEHRILAPSEPESLVNPARVSSMTCAHCHADERLAAKYNLPDDRVPAFRESYHGLALRAGSQSVAGCASCHGIHNILPSSDPGSTIHPAHLAETCGTCHPGAGQRFALGPVHVSANGNAEHVVVRLIRQLYLWLIPLTVAFMLLHHALDFVYKLRRGPPLARSPEQVTRMNGHFRIAHGLVVLSFPVLVLTGFALKFPDAWWAHPVLAWEGEFAVRGMVHRVAGVVLVLALVYHTFHLALSRRDRRILPALLPRLQDLKDLRAVLRRNLGWPAEKPRFGLFSYVEKLEYWAFMWGTAVMALSGFFLWFNTWTLSHLPSWILDASTALHYYEAILASLAILIWHFYSVIFDPDVYPMDRSWLTGRTWADHLRETRPGYYRRRGGKPAGTTSESGSPGEGAKQERTPRET